MKRKHVITMLVVAAVLAVAVWVLNRGTEKTWSESGAAVGSKVIELPVNDVAHITVQTASGTVNLAKKDDTWVVQERGDYPASFERVSNLLRKTWDLKTIQEVKVGPSQFPRLELSDPPQGTAAKVEFKDKDGKQLGALVLGKKYMKRAEGAGAGANEFPAGRYIMQPGGSRVSLVSEMFDFVEAKPENWLEKEFIKADNPNAITLAGPTEGQKWKLTRANETAEWKLEGASDAEKVDPAKVASITGMFARAVFADVLPNANPAETGLDNPTLLTIDTFDGFHYVLRIGKVMGENQAVSVEVNAQLANERTPGADEKPEDKARLDQEFQTKQNRLREKLIREKKIEGRVFLIAKSNIDQIVKDRASLLAQPSPSPAPAGSPAPGAANAGGAPTAPGTKPISVTTSPVPAPPAKAASPTPAAKPKK